MFSVGDFTVVNRMFLKLQFGGGIALRVDIVSVSERLGMNAFAQKYRCISTAIELFNPPPRCSTSIRAYRVVPMS